MFRLVVNCTKFPGIQRIRCTPALLYTHSKRNFSDDSTRIEKSTEQEPAEKQDKKELGGFAKSYETLTTLAENIDKPVKDTTSFKELLRNSIFVDVGIIVC